MTFSNKFYTNHETHKDNLIYFIDHDDIII